MSENNLKSAIQNLDYTNIKFLILQGKINIDSKDLQLDGDPVIILLKEFRFKEDHNKVAQILQYLINAGFNIHTTDSIGNNALHYAMANKYLKSIVILLKNSANINLKNKYGLTPIMLALEIKKKIIKNLIIPEELIIPENYNKINQNTTNNAYNETIEYDTKYDEFIQRVIDDSFNELTSEDDENEDEIKKIINDNIKEHRDNLEEINIKNILQESFRDIIKKIKEHTKIDFSSTDIKMKDLEDEKITKNYEEQYNKGNIKILLPGAGLKIINNQEVPSARCDTYLNKSITTFNKILECLLQETEMNTLNYLINEQNENELIKKEYEYQSFKINDIENEIVIPHDKDLYFNLENTNFDPLFISSKNPSLKPDFKHPNVVIQQNYIQSRNKEFTIDNKFNEYYSFDLEPTFMNTFKQTRDNVVSKDMSRFKNITIDNDEVKKYLGYERTHPDVTYQLEEEEITLIIVRDIQHNKTKYYFADQNNYICNLPNILNDNTYDDNIKYAEAIQLRNENSNNKMFRETRFDKNDSRNDLDPKSLNQFDDAGIAFPFEYYQFFRSRQDRNKFYIVLNEKHTNLDEPRRIMINGEYKEPKTKQTMLITNVLDPHFIKGEYNIAPNAYTYTLPSGGEIKGKTAEFRKFSENFEVLHSEGIGVNRLDSGIPKIPVITKIKVFTNSLNIKYKKNYMFNIYPPEVYLFNIYNQFIPQEIKNRVKQIIPNSGANSIISALQYFIRNELNKIYDKMKEGEILESIIDWQTFTLFIFIFIKIIYIRFEENSNKFKEFLKKIAANTEIIYYKNKIKENIEDYKYINNILLSALDNQKTKLKELIDDFKEKFTKDIKLFNTISYLTKKDYSFFKINNNIVLNNEEIFFSFKSEPIFFSEKFKYSLLEEDELTPYKTYSKRLNDNNYYGFKLDRDSPTTINTNDKKQHNYNGQNSFDFMDYENRNNFNLIFRKYFYDNHFDRYKENDTLLKDINNDMKKKILFDELIDSAQKIIDKKVINKIIEMLKKELPRLLLEYKGVGFIIKLLDYIQNNQDLIVDLLENIKDNDKLFLKEIQDTDINKIKFIEKIREYNFLISKISETIDSKYKEKNWDFKNIDEPDGFDLFLEQIIVKEDYDNVDTMLIEEKYDYDYKMVKICTDLALWNQVNKFNNSIYSNLLLTNQFIKIKVAGKIPLIQHQNTILFNNIIFKFLELITNNLENYNSSGYEMFYDKLNSETADQFRENIISKKNYPIFGENFLGCFLMLWDHAIYKMFSNDEECSILEFKCSQLFAPLNGNFKNFFQDLLNINTNNYSEPKIMEIYKKNNNDIDMVTYSEKNLKEFDKNKLSEGIIKKNIYNQSGGTTIIDSIGKWIEHKQRIEEGHNIIKDLKERDINKLLTYDYKFKKENIDKQKEANCSKHAMVNMLSHIFYKDHKIWDLIYKSCKLNNRLIESLDEDINRIRNYTGKKIYYYDVINPYNIPQNKNPTHGEMDNFLWLISLVDKNGALIKKIKQVRENDELDKFGAKDIDYRLKEIPDQIDPSKKTTDGFEAIVLNRNDELQKKLREVEQKEIKDLKLLGIILGTGSHYTCIKPIYFKDGQVKYYHINSSNHSYDLDPIEMKDIFQLIQQHHKVTGDEINPGLNMFGARAYIIEDDDMPKFEIPKKKDDDETKRKILEAQQQKLDERKNKERQRLQKEEEQRLRKEEEQRRQEQQRLQKEEEERLQKEKEQRRQEQRRLQKEEEQRRQEQQRRAREAGTKESEKNRIRELKKIKPSSLEDQRKKFLFICRDIRLSKENYREELINKLTSSVEIFGYTILNEMRLIKKKDTVNKFTYDEASKYLINFCKEINIYLDKKKAKERKNLLPSKPPQPPQSTVVSSPPSPPAPSQPPQPPRSTVVSSPPSPPAPSQPPRSTVVSSPPPSPPAPSGKENDKERKARENQARFQAKLAKEKAREKKQRREEEQRKAEINNIVKNVWNKKIEYKDIKGGRIRRLKINNVNFNKINSDHLKEEFIQNILSDISKKFKIEKKHIIIKSITAGSINIDYQINTNIDNMNVNENIELQETIKFIKRNDIMKDNSMITVNNSKLNIPSYNFKDILNANDDMIKIYQAIEEYLKNKNEKEYINFLYIIFQNQKVIFDKIGNSNGMKIFELLKDNKDIIDKLENALKKYIKIFPFLLDIKSMNTPLILNIKDNKPLKLFVEILAVVINIYLGHNLYNAIIRIYAKELNIKDPDEINIKMPKVKKLLENVKRYLTEGKFSKNMIRVVLNIKDNKYQKEKFETIDLIFEDLFKQLLKLPIGYNDFELLNDFKIVGKAYYKNLYQKFINNAYSVIINYNRFIINQYKYIRTIKELINLK